MRLRQLSTTQSVIFFAPPEVHRSIQDHTKNYRGTFGSFDVISWTIEQTCRSIEHLQPLFIQQGLEYHARQQAQWGRPDAWWMDETIVKQVLESLEEPERHNLEELYGPATGSRFSLLSNLPTLGPEKAQAQLTKLKNIAKRTTQNAAHASMQEEQERELHVEVEEEKHSERPPPATALKHTLDPVMNHIVSTGLVPPGNSAINVAFNVVHQTSLSKLMPDQKGTNLLASPDFCKTVSRAQHERTDQYQRPLQWILWSNTAEQAMVISQHEANLLLPKIRRSTNTHLILYSAPTSRKTLQFNDLRYFSIPALPNGWQVPAAIKCEIGLFAGRTYFAWGDLAMVRAALGLSSGQVATDFGFGASNSNNSSQWCTFSLEFIGKWLELRRNGQDTASSPMGHVLSGRALTEGDGFFG